MRRWRARNPEKVRERNAAAYRKNRERILAKKKAQRYGRGRAMFLERARAANRRYYERKKAALCQLNHF